VKLQVWSWGSGRTMHICGTALERSAHYKEAIQAYTAALEENNLGVQKDKKTI